MNSKQTLIDHYAADGLRERLTAGLAQAGLAEGPIDWKQLAQLDQFHTRGLMASSELAEALDAKAGETLLDLGSGFGGPARFIAATRGVHVTGIELSDLYVTIANEFSERTGLSDKAKFVQGDAAALPFDANSFDLAWTLHVSMNIEDKSGFYAGVHRVLKPGGKFAIYDVAKGTTEPVLYPAPWSPVPEFSFLCTLEETRHQLLESGFTILTYQDATTEAIGWLSKIQAATPPQPDAPKRVTLGQTIGPQVLPMLRNMGQNFMEGRTRVLRAIVQKPISE